MRVQAQEPDKRRDEGRPNFDGITSRIPDHAAHLMSALSPSPILSNSPTGSARRAAFCGAVADDWHESMIPCRWSGFAWIRSLGLCIYSLHSSCWFGTSICRVMRSSQSAVRHVPASYPLSNIKSHESVPCRRTRGLWRLARRLRHDGITTKPVGKFRSRDVSVGVDVVGGDVAVLL